MEKSIIKAIVFDLDDTLYKERSFVESGFTAVADYLSQEKNFDTETTFKDLIMILDMDGRGAIFDTLLKYYNIYSQGLVDRLVDIYRFHSPHIEVYSEVPDMLQSLKDNYRLGIITDGLVLVQKNKVKALGIEAFFDQIIYTDELGDGKAKPASDPFMKIVRDFGCNPGEAIYVGDNPHKDFLGAKEVGMITVRVLQGIYKDVILSQEYEADYSVHSLLGLKKLVLL